jgi:hypothetical protein
LSSTRRAPTFQPQLVERRPRVRQPGQEGGERGLIGEAERDLDAEPRPGSQGAHAHRARRHGRSQASRQRDRRPGRGGLRRRRGEQRGSQDRELRTMTTLTAAMEPRMGSLISDIVPFPPWLRSVKYDKS